MCPTSPCEIYRNSEGFNQRTNPQVDWRTSQLNRRSSTSPILRVSIRLCLGRQNPSKMCKRFVLCIGICRCAWGLQPASLAYALRWRIEVALIWNVYRHMRFCFELPPNSRRQVLHDFCVCDAIRVRTVWFLFEKFHAFISDHDDRLSLTTAAHVAPAANFLYIYFSC